MKSQVRGKLLFFLRIFSSVALVSAHPMTARELDEIDEFSFGANPYGERPVAHIFCVSEQTVNRDSIEETKNETSTENSTDDLICKGGTSTCRERARRIQSDIESLYGTNMLLDKACKAEKNCRQWVGELRTCGINSVEDFNDPDKCASLQRDCSRFIPGHEFEWIEDDGVYQNYCGCFRTDVIGNCIAPYFQPNGLPLNLGVDPCQQAKSERTPLTNKWWAVKASVDSYNQECDPDITMPRMPDSCLGL